MKTHFHGASFQVVYLGREILGEILSLLSESHDVGSYSYALLLGPAPRFAFEARHFHPDLAHLQQQQQPQR